MRTEGSLCTFREGTNYPDFRDTTRQRPCHLLGSERTLAVQCSAVAPMSAMRCKYYRIKGGRKKTNELTTVSYYVNIL